MFPDKSKDGENTGGFDWLPKNEEVILNEALIIYTKR